MEEERRGGGRKRWREGCSIKRGEKGGKRRAVAREEENAGSLMCGVGIEKEGKGEKGMKRCSSGIGGKRRGKKVCSERGENGGS